MAVDAMTNSAGELLGVVDQKVAMKLKHGQKQFKILDKKAKRQENIANKGRTRKTQTQKVTTLRQKANNYGKGDAADSIISSGKKLTGIARKGFTPTYIFSKQSLAEPINQELNSLPYSFKELKMMRYKINENNGIYFTTHTIVEWLPVFTEVKYFQTKLIVCNIVRKIKACMSWGTSSFLIYFI